MQRGGDRQDYVSTGNEFSLGESVRSITQPTLSIYEVPGAVLGTSFWMNKHLVTKLTKLHHGAHILVERLVMTCRSGQGSSGQIQQSLNSIAKSWILPLGEKKRIALEGFKQGTRRPLFNSHTPR